MNNGSILIISNNEETGNFISDKVKLLRECDIIQAVTYIEAISVLNTTTPSMIIVYCSNADSIGIVKEIRLLKTLDKVPIILVMDNFIEELLLYAFDNGIDDFFFMNDPDSIILMRILLTLQKSVLYKQIEIKDDILVTSGIIDKYSGIYLKEQAPNALKNFFSKSIEENMENTVFMCIKPVENSGKKFKLQSIANVVKSILRGNDIIAYGKNSTFYMVLYNSGASGAQSAASRIRKLLVNECGIYASAAEITASFEEMEIVLLKSLKSQIVSGIEYRYIYNLNPDEAVEALDMHDTAGKKFKEFKKDFYGEFEKLVSPVFFKMQEKAAELFPRAKIDFDIAESESKFSLSQDKNKSEIIISYPSYLKLIVDIKHSSELKRKQARRLSVDFEDFSSEKLSSLILDVFKEFEKLITPEIKQLTIDTKTSGENKDIKEKKKSGKKSASKKE